MHRTRTIDYAVVLSGEGEGEPPKADVPAKPRRARSRDYFLSTPPTCKASIGRSS
jgi:hypothetical protein